MPCPITSITFSFHHLSYKPCTSSQLARVFRNLHDAIHPEPSLTSPGALSALPSRHTWKHIILQRQAALVSVHVFQSIGGCAENCMVANVRMKSVMSFKSSMVFNMIYGFSIVLDATVFLKIQYPLSNIQYPIYQQHRSTNRSSSGINRISVINRLWSVSFKSSILFQMIYRSYTVLDATVENTISTFQHPIPGWRDRQHRSIKRSSETHSMVFARRKFQRKRESGKQESTRLRLKVREIER